MTILKDKQREYAWAAGFFDGEGCILIMKTKRGLSTNYTLRVCISQKYKLPLEKFANLFGGRIQDHPSGYQWVCSARVAGEFLEKVLPYLTLKRQQAEVGLAFQRRRVRGAGVASEREAARQQDDYDHRLLKQLKMVAL